MKWVFAAILSLFSVNAYAAQSTLSITITIQTSNSTSVKCGTSTSYTLASPPAGQVVCPLIVQPADWQGALTITQNSGPQDDAFTIKNGNLVVGSNALNKAGNYSLTIGATP